MKSIPAKSCCANREWECNSCGLNWIQTSILRPKCCPICGKLQPSMRSPNLWVMEKTKETKKGPKTYAYWMATWRERGKTRNVHLGGCERMGADEARQKAIKLKYESVTEHVKCIS